MRTLSCGMTTELCEVRTGLMNMGEWPSETKPSWPNPALQGSKRRETWRSLVGAEMSYAEKQDLAIRRRIVNTGKKDKLLSLSELTDTGLTENISAKDTSRAHSVFELL